MTVDIDKLKGILSDLVIAQGRCGNCHEEPRFLVPVDKVSLCPSCLGSIVELLASNQRNLLD